MKMILNVISRKYRGSLSWVRVRMKGFVKVENPGSNPSLTPELYFKKQLKLKRTDRTPYDQKCDFPRLCQIVPVFSYTVISFRRLRA